MRFKTLALTALMCLCASASAVQTGGWSVTSSYMWRMTEDPDYAFTKGTPAKIVEVDRLVKNHQARFKGRQSITQSFTFKVGCMFQSRTPAFEMQVTPLDIRITDNFNGFAFARFMVDQGQEFSLRGEIIPPARLLFAPLTKSQEKKLSDLLLQMREGGILTIGILEGENSDPRIYQIPLKGFLEFSDFVISDCARLNQKVGNQLGEVHLLPDYLTREPEKYAPLDYSLKPKPKGNDGLQEALKPAAKIEEPVAEEKPEAPVPEGKKPDIKYFEPGGGAASIGPDGKPITRDNAPEDEPLGQAQGPMQIDSSGAPVASDSAAPAKEESSEEEKDKSEAQKEAEEAAAQDSAPPKNVEPSKDNGARPEALSTETRAN